jgi:hypothetical protein
VEAALFLAVSDSRFIDSILKFIYQQQLDLAIASGRIEVFTGSTTFAFCFDAYLKLTLLSSKMH